VRASFASSYCVRKADASGIGRSYATGTEPITYISPCLLLTPPNARVILQSARLTPAA